MLSVSAQETVNLETQIDFDLSLKDIVLLIDAGNSSEIDMNKYIVLEGVVSSREILYADEENFVVLLIFDFKAIKLFCWIRREALVKLKLVAVLSSTKIVPSITSCS